MKLAADYAANAAYPVHNVRGTYAIQATDVNEYKRNAFYNGYKKAEKDVVDQACKWLSSHLSDVVNYYKENGAYVYGNREHLIEMFRKDMEEMVWNE